MGKFGIVLVGPESWILRCFYVGQLYGGKTVLIGVAVNQQVFFLKVVGLFLNGSVLFVVSQACLSLLDIMCVFRYLPLLYIRLDKLSLT